MGKRIRSSRNIGHELHLQQHDRVLDLQFALLEPPHLQLVVLALHGNRFDQRIEAPVLQLQLGNSQFDGFWVQG